MLWLGVALLGTPHRSIDAQGAAVAPRAEWRAWAFGRVGMGRSGPAEGRNDMLASLAGGVAASYGSIVGMVRATDTERLAFSDSPNEGVQDYALLAGLRSHGNRRFVVGAAGIARATPLGGDSRVGSLTPERRITPAFDLSAHADSRVGGIAMTVAGVLGPAANTRYLAVSLGAELGWFGFSQP